jgi:hypothetical protein
MEDFTELKRAHELLKAVLDIMREARRGYYVKDIFHLTAHYDGTENDGLCLMEDIKDYLGVED